MEKQQEVDYIIVGQGLAGTLLSYFLLAENKRVVVLDFPHEGRSSKIAAGLINPVTGRRIAKSWRFEELSAFAKRTYHEIEDILGVKILYDRPILRALHNVFEENEWSRRSSFSEFEAYMKDETKLAEYEGKLKPAYAWGELVGSAQLAMPILIDTWQKYLENLSCFFKEDIDYDEIRMNENDISFRLWTAKKIIFCEGAKAIMNPYFNHLPFLVTKGELLLVRIPGIRSQRVVKHKLFLVPLVGELFWVGSTSKYEFNGVRPTEFGRQNLIESLEKTLDVPFEVVEHLAGIRPTTSDLRPFLGLHGKHPALGIFNGLGTKGAIMAPFFARQMADFLCYKSGLEPEVDIARFENGLKTEHFFKK